MFQRLLPAFVLFLGVQAALGQSPSNQPAAAPAKFELLPIERQIVELTNAERAKAGLPAYAVDPELMRSARAHCTWMAQNQRLQHTTANVAENIAMGQPDAAGAIQSWLNSPMHRANMLNAQYKRMGAAAYRTGQGGQVFWCQQFLW